MIKFHIIHLKFDLDFINLLFFFINQNIFAWIYEIYNMKRTLNIFRLQQMQLKRKLYQERKKFNTNLIWKT